MCILCMAATGAATMPLAEGRASHVGAPDFIVASFVRPVLFQIGPLSIKSFGLFVGLATVKALFGMGEDFKRARVKLTDLQEAWGAAAMIAGGAFMAKVHYVLGEWGNDRLDYKSFDYSHGYTFQGLVMGAFLAVCVCAYARNLNLWMVLDVVIPNTLAGHVLGKVGCFLSGDGCYGPAADPRYVPWAMSFPNGLDPVRTPVHPTPLYEGLTALTITVLSWYFVPWPLPKRFHGRKAAFCLGLSGFVRVFLEKYRRHPGTESAFGLTEFQVVALVFLLIALFIEFVVVRRRGDIPEDPDEFAMDDKDSDAEGSDDSDDEEEEPGEKKQATGMPKAQSKPQAKKTAAGKRK